MTTRIPMSEPDEEAIRFGNRLWARIQPLICPLCQVMFYGWHPLDSDLVDLHEDAEPTDGKGERQTCGKPDCRDREQRHQLRRRKHAAWQRKTYGGRR